MPATSASPSRRPTFGITGFGRGGGEHFEREAVLARRAVGRETGVEEGAAGP